MASTQLSPPTTSREPVTRFLPWTLLTVGAVLLLAHLPLLVVHARQIWLRPHYQFFPLVLLGAAALAYARLRNFGPLTPAPARWSYPLVGLSWALLALAELLYSSWLGTVSALVLLAALLFALGGGRLFRQAFPAWLLLWLAVPPPFELDRQLILSLQTLTAQWSSRVLDLLGVFHVMAGNVVEISGRRLLVEEACSGVNSLFSILACTLFFVLWVRRPLVQSLLLLAAAVAWVLLANVARVTFVTYACARWGIDLTTGWQHEGLGLLLFAIALGLLWSTDRLLQFLLVPGKMSAVEKTPGASLNPGQDPGRTERFSVGLAGWGVGVAYAALLAAHVALYGFGVGEENAGAGPATAVQAAEGDVLPAQVASWERQGFKVETRNPGSAFGEFSRIWNYHCGQNLGAVSLDYPFPDWHDLTRCYTGQGWRIEEETVHPAAEADGPVGHVEVRMTKPGYRSGYLLFCEFDPQGVVLEPRRGGSYLSVHRHQSALRRWWQVMNGTPAPTPGDPPGPVYQLQLFVESYAPLAAADRDRARTLFLHSFESLRPQGSVERSARGEDRAALDVQ
jgi:exosortase